MLRATQSSLPQHTTHFSYFILNKSVWQNSRPNKPRPPAELCVAGDKQTDGQKDIAIAQTPHF